VCLLGVRRTCLETAGFDSVHGDHSLGALASCAYDA
jgi:hypothetical protein